MSADTEAYELSKRVSPELTDAEREYALMVGRHESYYGRATRPAVWQGSHNWGAIQGSGPAGSFSTTDTHADGSPYAGKFKRYNNDEEGWLDLVRILLKPNVRAALNRDGNADEAARLQRLNGYYEAPVDAYRRALERNYRVWQNAMGKVGALKFPLVVAGLPSGSGSSVASPLPTSSFVVRRVAALPMVWFGSSGAPVVVVCKLLNIAPTRNFDLRVTDAVQAFQRAHNMKPDGIVGALTWTKLLEG